MNVAYAAAMSDTPHMASLSDEDLETWAAVATVLEWLPAALDAQLQRDAGLTHFEYGILYALRAADDRQLRMSTLAQYSNSSLSRLSRAATRLEAKGWMRREDDPTDGRFTLAVLTEAGARTVEKAAPGHVQLVQQVVFDPLTKAQGRQLGEISRRILTGIRPEGAWEPGQGTR